MAFKAIYGLNVSLTAATAANAGQLKIDNSAATSLATALGADFTYAALSDGVNYEIVRIDSVTAPFLSVTRAFEGTTSSAFPIGACLRFVWIADGITAVAGGVTFTVTGSGVAVVTSTGTNSWNVDVPITTLTGDTPIEILGTFPDFEIATNATFGGCCCGGGGGGSGGTITEITASGIASVTGGTGPTANIDVPTLNLIAGANVTITGAYPNFTIAASGGGGGGGVASVTGSTKILISGSLSNPVVNLIVSGVGAGTYNGVTYDAYGCATFTNPSYVPVTNITSLSPEITVGSAGPGFPTLTFTPGSGGTVYVDSQSVFDTTGGASYTTAIPGIAVTLPILTSAQKAVVTALATVYDTSTPTAPPAWGLGVFDASGLVNGTTTMPTCTHIVKYIVPGPTGASQSLFMKTTALSGTMSAITKSITVEVYPT